MKDVLLNKIKYLLNYKLTTDNKKIEILIENIIYNFLTNMEKNYNDLENNTKYYNFLLNKLYKNIKSIIIPADTFNYHQSGFLELSMNLKNKLSLYQENNIEITKEIKEDILKQNYYYYLFQVLKNNNNYNGYNNKERNNLKYLEKYLTISDSITLSNINKSHKKEYKVLYPDGTSYNYYLYTKTFITNEILNINIINILKTIIGSKKFTNGSINSSINFLDEINDKYITIFNDINKENHSIFEIIDNTLMKIEKEKIIYKKLEYFKNINIYLLDMFNYKVTQILNDKDNQNIENIIKEISIIEENLLYNQDLRLNNNLEYIRTLKNIKIKISNYKKNSNQTKEKEYLIYSKDHKKEEKVSSSVQPINIENQYVIIHILDIKNCDEKVLVRMNVNIVNYDTLAKKIYGNLYMTLKELKHMFSSSDLGVFSKESETIRKAIATRITNPTIMDIIKQERNNFLGEFIYNKEEDRCIIYKNKSIEEMLSKVM